MQACPGFRSRRHQPRHWSTTSSVPFKNPSRQACRWILPLEVLGMLPALISTIASTDISCSTAIWRRIASNASAKAARSRCRPRSVSCTITSRSWPSTSTENAAPAPARRRRMAPFDGQLDVLRIVVQPADDDQVLEPSVDEQLVVAHEAEIARAQVGPARRRSNGHGMSESFRQALPIALGNARAGHPDFAHLVGGTARRVFPDRRSEFPGPAACRRSRPATRAPSSSGRASTT